MKRRIVHEVSTSFLKPPSSWRLNEGPVIPTAGLFINQAARPKQKGGVNSMNNPSFQLNGKSGYYIFRRYVTRNGKRIYPKRPSSLKFG